MRTITPSLEFYEFPQREPLKTIFEGNQSPERETHFILIPLESSARNSI